MPPSALRLARIQCDMTLLDLARETGISESHLSRLERGLVIPTKIQKIKISEIVNVPVQELWEEVE